MTQTRLSTYPHGVASTLSGQLAGHEQRPYRAARSDPLAGSPHSSACAGWWKRAVAWKRARPVTAGVHHGKFPGRDAVGDDPGSLIGERADVGRTTPRASSVSCRKAAGPPSRTTTSSGPATLASQPAFGDPVPQRDLAREVSVASAVADAERPATSTTVVPPGPNRRSTSSAASRIASAARSPALGPSSALAVEDGHLRRVVPRAGDRVGRHGGLDRGEVRRRSAPARAAPRDSASRSRRRAPTSGTMSSPLRQRPRRSPPGRRSPPWPRRPRAGPPPAPGCAPGSRRRSGAGARGSRSPERSGDQWPASSPRDRTPYAVMPMPSSRHVGRISASMPREISEYSICRSAIGCTAGHGGASPRPPRRARCART